MSNDSTFSDGTVPVDADLDQHTTTEEHHHEEHETADGQTVSDGEPGIDEGLVTTEHANSADDHDENGLEHGLGAP